MKTRLITMICCIAFTAMTFAGGGGSSSGGGGGGGPAANPDNAGFYTGIMTLICTNCVRGTPPILADTFVQIDANGVAPNGKQIVFGNEFRFSGADDVFFSNGERCRHRYMTSGTIMNGVINTSGSGSLLCGRFGDYSVRHTATLERQVGNAQTKMTVDQPFTWKKQ